MKKFILSAVLVLVFAAGVLASEFAPALDFSARLAYPSVVSNEESPQEKISGSASLAASCMFNTDILPALWFIPTLTADYSNTAQPLNIEDERFLFSEWLDVYGSFGMNYDIMEGWEVKARGFARSDFSKQTADEKTGLGLYDYIDQGFYLENTNAFMSGGAENSLTAGVKYLDRRFRNYTTLLSQSVAVTTTPNNYTKEKDSLIYSAYISDEVTFGKSGWLAYINFNYDYIPYLEQKLIAQNGSLETGRRVDKTGRLSLTVPFYGANNTGVEFQYDFVKNLSNQNYFDSLGTTDMSDDVFTKGFYNFVENTIKFSVTYELPWKLFSSYSPMANISFSLDMVGYETRKAKDSAGAYTADLQKDNNYTIGLDIKQNITEWWNWFFDLNYTRYNSNMKYEAFGLYNYAFITVSLGSGVSF